jgi:hypothetical protein
VPGETLQRSQSVDRRELSDCIHSCVEIERGKSRAGVTDFGNTQAYLGSHLCERIGGHELLS